MSGPPPPVLVGSQARGDPTDPLLANRAAQALLRSTAVLLAADDERAVLDRLCEALAAELEGLVLVWLWFGEADTEEIVPQVHAGPARHYARSLRIPRNPQSLTGPAFRAVVDQAVGLYRSVDFEPMGPFRGLAAEMGIRSVLALPLASRLDDRRGVFLLYADADDYFDRVGLGLLQSLGDLFSAVLTRAARFARVAHAATRDALTGLLNRHALPSLAQRLERQTDIDPPGSVIVVDLDHFKQVNDRHGHDTGDRLLQQVAAALQSTLRRSDACLRWGGEEFLVVLPGTNLEGAATAARHLQSRLRGLRLPVTSGELAVRASFGVAELNPGEALSQAIGRADAALYGAKRAGRDCIQLG